MRSPALLCVALCLVTSSLALGEEVARESKLTPDALVEQLGAESYALREQARQELERREFAATDALKEGLSSPDLEVRYHCERLINDIRERATQRRLDDFVKSPGDAKDYDFPAWKQARDLLGDSELTRQLYVEMYRAESDTLKLVQARDESISSHIDARARFLQRRAQGLYQAPLGNGNIAALLLAAGLQEGKLSPMGHSMVYQLCYQPVFRDAMQSDKAAPLKKLLGRYVLTTEDQSAYQGMTLTMQYKMHEEGLACASKILSGKTTAPHIKQYAVLTIAKLGDEKQIDSLKPLLEDKLLCSQMQVDKVMHKTELRDIALFSIVHLSKQDPKKFGFERYTPNDQMLVNVHTLGFPSDEKRQAAFDSWKKFEAEQAKK
jgi:hypothetical protein